MKKKTIEIIPDRKHIEQTLELAGDYDVVFEYNDFMLPMDLDQEDRCRQKIEFYRGLGRDCSRDTLHGAFLDVVVHSSDLLIREASRKRVYQSMEIARQMGVRGVVFHTGLIANFRADYYKKTWLDRNEEFWSRVLEDFPGIYVYMENMFDEDDRCLTELARRMSEKKYFGICLDYAHAAAFGQTEEIDRWVRRMAPYVRHIHINDNDLRNDLHLPLGDGRIDWAHFEELYEQCQIDASVLIEVNGYEAQKKSLEFLRKNGIL